MEWLDFGAGLAVASLAWAIFWGIYTHRAAPKVALGTARELERDRREREALAIVRSHALSVFTMCDNWLAAYQERPDEVHQGIVTMKVRGRLGGLREAWAEHAEHVRPRGIADAYGRLAVDETMKWLETPGMTTAVDLPTVMRRVEEVRGRASSLAEAAEWAVEGRKRRDRMSSIPRSERGSRSLVPATHAPTSAPPPRPRSSESSCSPIAYGGGNSTWRIAS